MSGARMQVEAEAKKRQKEDKFPSSMERQTKATRKMYKRQARIFKTPHRFLGRPRQQWTFKSNELTHGKTSHAEYNGYDFQTNIILTAAQ